MKIFLFLLPIFLLAIEPITPIPQTIEYNKQKALLGKKLFFDTSFSADGKIACVSCHLPKYDGADPRVVSIGVYGKLGNIQSPTVYNSVYNFRQFWNGRARDLKEQILGPTHNPVEMGIDNQRVIKIINSKYQNKFFSIYHTKLITFEMFQDIIAEFEKALITPNCKFDKWLKGEVKLTKLEKDGYHNFKKLGSKVAIDDFGSGYSNFGHVLNLKIDYLKIDGSLIKNLETDEKMYLIVETIVEFAKKTNVKTIAEFVHNEAVLNKVKKLDIDYSQGFYLGEPKGNIC